MRILKFGGSSVRSAEWIDRVLDIGVGQLPSAPVLVSSAMGKTTDDLQTVAFEAEKGELGTAHESLRRIRELHTNAAGQLLTGERRVTCLSRLEEFFRELGSIVKGLGLLKERTRRSNDLILSFGERMATLLVACRADERGINKKLLDARSFIKTDDNFGAAAPIDGDTRRLIHRYVKPQPGLLLITQGFIASNSAGITTTLGRGGSDFTATILGAALEAEEVQIWTDVDGILTADPRIVPAAATIPEMSYREAAELAYFGARVVHPSTIQPAVKRTIPISVKNTGNPGGGGTKLVLSLPSEGPRAVACKQGITVINVSSGRMLMAYGFLKAIFEIFEIHKTSVDLIATSEVSVSMTIDDTESLDAIIEALNGLGSVSMRSDMSIVSLVGQDLWKDSAIISRVFSTLSSIPIRMISLGSSDTNLSLVVPADRTEETVTRLHGEFFEGADRKR
jgi:aspartate kinase